MVFKIKNYIMPFSLMLLIPAFNSVYLLMNNSKRPVHSLVTDFDRAIPFIKLFVIPYIIWYFFLFLSLSYICIRDREVYYKTLTATITGLLIAYLTYFFYQTTVPRPELQGTDFITGLVAYIYNSDQPYNCFPSIHVLTSYLVIKAAKSVSNRDLIIKYSIIGIALLIIVSTLFIKQHVVLDVISAVLLGEALYKLVNSPSLREKQQKALEVFYLRIIRNKDLSI